MALLVLGSGMPGVLGYPTTHTINDALVGFAMLVYVSVLLGLSAIPAMAGQARGWQSASRRICQRVVARAFLEARFPECNRVEWIKPRSVRNTGALFDECPVLIEKAGKPGNDEANAGKDRTGQGRERTGAEYIHEQAITDRVGLVARPVLQSVVEDE